MRNIVGDITQKGLSLSQILRYQQEYHEWRRWSVYDLIRDRELTNADEHDRAALWHAARAELTTQPAGIRLAVEGDRLAREVGRENRIGAMVLHAAAAWSARFWLEEEAHHEVAYGVLLEKAGQPPIPQEEVVEHRGFFPEDNYARVCILQACVEVEAVIHYGEVARTSRDPLVRDVFGRIMRDEVQHQEYFVSFARGLVEASVYPAKDVMAMAYVWLRPGGGETFGSTRERQTQRQGFVNWWERVRTDSESGLAFDDQIRAERLQRKKERAVLKAVNHSTGVSVNSVAELQRAYFKSLTGSSHADRLRHAVSS